VDPRRARWGLLVPLRGQLRMEQVRRRRRPPRRAALRGRHATAAGTGLLPLFSCPVTMRVSVSVYDELIGRALETSEIKLVMNFVPYSQMVVSWNQRIGIPKKMMKNWGPFLLA